MGLRDISRSAVGGYIKLVRVPVDAGLKLVGRGPGPKLAADRVDAAARETAGGLLGDEQLKNEGRRRHRATDERARAAKLRSKAAARTERADEALEQRTERATTRRKSAAKQASARKAAASEQKQRRQQRAAETERKRKQVTRTATARAEEAVDKRDRAARLGQLETKAEALAERSDALQATDEAQRLESAAAAAKAERKG